MHIPECILWAMGDDGCSAVKIFCEGNIREEIESRFTSEFNKEYEKIMDMVEKEDGTCYEKEEEYNPLKEVRVTDYGVLISFYALALYCGDYGDFLASYDAGDALIEALKTIKSEYPAITYDGYVAYCWSDVHSGEACQYEISSEKKSRADNTVYDFVGEALEEAFSDEDFWERIYDDFDCEEASDYKKVIKFFYDYSKWVPSDSIEKIIELSEEDHSDITESLKEFAEVLRSGKHVEIEEEETDTANLPDGYAEALDMFLKAEEITGNIFKKGIASSEDTFGTVIEKAESGDAEAKYIVGKYFIAEHTEKEKERAVRWIREAAQSGVEEAEEYMEKHKSLFV